MRQHLVLTKIGPPPDSQETENDRVEFSMTSGLQGSDLVDRFIVYGSRHGSFGRSELSKL